MTPQAVLGCRELTFAYRRGATPVVRGLTADFAAGSLTVVTGPSGSGKSTLLYVLALMLRPTTGTVVWDGRDSSSLPDADRSALRAARTGFVFQDAMLDPARTVLDNVCEAGIFAGLTRSEAVARGRRLLSRFGLDHRADHRPGEVSGGQAQRVGLCRALLTDPTVIFGDEPTGNLDAGTAALVWDALTERARGGATVVVATHDLGLAASADARLELT